VKAYNGNLRKTPRIGVHLKKSIMYDQYIT